MGNGDDAVWSDIKELRRDMSNLARDGCGHKKWHEETSKEIRADLNTERRERVAMGETLTEKIEKVGDSAIKEMKAIRNQIMGSLILVLIVAVIVSKVLR